MLSHVPAVADRPDHKAGAAYDVAGGEDTVQAGHHGAEIDRHGTPAADLEVGSAEQGRQIFRVETERLDHEIRFQRIPGTIDHLRRLPAAGVGHAEVDAVGANIGDDAVLAFKSF